MSFQKRLTQYATQGCFLESIRSYATTFAKVLLVLLVSNLLVETSTVAYAGFVVLDDFHDFNGVDEPLESIREYEDFFGSGTELSGLLILDQDPGEEAVLRYATAAGYDFGTINQFVFSDVGFPDPALVATLEVDSIVVASGIYGLDDAGFDTLIFDLDDSLGFADSVSFHFTTTGPDPFFFASSQLSGRLSAVPEPTSLLLVGMALVCGTGVRRRRKIECCFQAGEF